MEPSPPTIPSNSWFSPEFQSVSFSFVTRDLRGMENEYDKPCTPKITTLLPSFIPDMHYMAQGLTLSQTFTDFTSDKNSCSDISYYYEAYLTN